MVCAEAMRETRMLRCLVREMGKAELPYASQSLEFGGIDQTCDQRTDRIAHIDADNVVNRIPVNSF